MKRLTRLHVAICVSDLQESSAFYRRLFAIEPTRETDEQIDWILNDPPANVSIFCDPNRPPGLDHIGIDTSIAESRDAGLRMKAKEYASNAYAIDDPDGIRVEIFSTDGR
jgi:catechol 2,3-dioxygenase-like lactoylglutathione lyase family enzyme